VRSEGGERKTENGGRNAERYDSVESQNPHYALRFQFSVFRFPNALRTPFSKMGSQGRSPPSARLRPNFLLSFSEKESLGGGSKKAIAFYLSENGMQKTENGIL